MQLIAETGQFWKYKLRKLIEQHKLQAIRKDW